MGGSPGTLWPNIYVRIRSYLEPSHAKSWKSSTSRLRCKATFDGTSRSGHELQCQQRDELVGDHECHHGGGVELGLGSSSLEGPSVPGATAADSTPAHEDDYNQDHRHSDHGLHDHVPKHLVRDEHGRGLPQHLSLRWIERLAQHQVCDFLSDLCRACSELGSNVCTVIGTNKAYVRSRKSAEHRLINFRPDGLQRRTYPVNQPLNPALGFGRSDLPGIRSPNDPGNLCTDHNGWWGRWGPSGLLALQRPGTRLGYLDFGCLAGLAIGAPETQVPYDSVEPWAGSLWGPADFLPGIRGGSSTWCVWVSGAWVARPQRSSLGPGLVGSTGQTLHWMSSRTSPARSVAILASR